MDTYFFSHHVPDPKMIEDLGVPLTTRFKGEISNIQAQGNLISFTEALCIGGERIKVNHTIPAQSIVIVEGSPLLQQAWLEAGVSTLLVPQFKNETSDRGVVVSKYCGLLQVHKIEVITSVWKTSTNTEVKSNQKESAEKPHPVNPSGSFSIGNLFQHLKG
ncbi:hypothetical protein [Iningainema tapete]|uniref:Uncharacterized protein n=1 Tax=Iningainema tapete BLCC-T55 TaxID=2748662 RepID=A0A8J7BZH4_9CYAN|nr:hypothetical protein [Iningainema tapete]MBD2777677.1 hypothetical protein [Iningainema tapete BLCC-T55]